MLSKRCEYGLRATCYLSSLDREGYVSIGTISEDLDISFPFLTKIFQKLNDAGLLSSRRGPKGGVMLTKPSGEIPLYEIVVSMGGDDLFEECVLDLPGCGDADPCPLHEQWTEQRGRVELMFRETTLDDLPDVRLAPTDECL